MIWVAPYAETAAMQIGCLIRQLPSSEEHWRSVCFRPIADIRPDCDSSLMDDANGRFEIVRATGADEVSVELWDRSLAPDGLAFEAVAKDDGSVTVTGYQVPVPFATLDRFLQEARSYLSEELGDERSRN